MGHLVRPVNALGMSSSVCILGHNTCAHVAGDVMWRAMVMEKVFFKSINSGDDTTTGGNSEVLMSVTHLSATDCNISLLTNNRNESTLSKTHDFETRNIPY